LVSGDGGDWNKNICLKYFTSSFKILFGDSVQFLGVKDLKIIECIFHPVCFIFVIYYTRSFLKKSPPFLLFWASMVQFLLLSTCTVSSCISFVNMDSCDLNCFCFRDEYWIASKGTFKSVPYNKSALTTVCQKKSVLNDSVLVQNKLSSNRLWIHFQYPRPRGNSVRVIYIPIIWWSDCILSPINYFWTFGARENDIRIKMTVN
jgi:hypothetical protein